MKHETEEFSKHIEKIKNSNVIVIVEGKKDRAALNKFGISNIIELSKKPLFQIVEEVANSNDECIILTDLDRKGKEIYGKLNSDLQKHGVKINNKFRNFLFKNTKLRQIEGMNTYVQFI
ncbi:MAG TPA: toprim domain-containing protein [Candidatus Nanoarchaeia archaeon]|nr:toprim domain-containing protein [Candidatus Nanoarchaeia archaeon]